MSSTLNRELVDKFSALMMEYIHLVNTSETINSMENRINIMKLGLTAITHIFVLSISITKSVETTGTYTDRGIYCFVEYIEQVSKTNLSQTVDYVDVIQFMYNKTVAELYGGNSTPVERISNFLSLNVPANTTDESDHQLQTLLSLLDPISIIILWFEHPDISNMKRLELVHVYIQQIVPLLVQTEIASPDCRLISIVSTIQDTMNMNYSEYVDLLDAFAKYLKKIIKHKQIPTSEMVRDKKLWLIADGASIFQGKRPVYDHMFP